MPDSLDGLDARQRAAVEHPPGPLLVLGGAGTGKTLVLARRFERLAAEERPEAVLALLPGEAAAARLREVLEERLEPGWEELRVATFHGFAARLVADEALEAGLDPFVSEAGLSARLALLLDHVDGLALRHHELRGNPVPLLASFLRRIDRLKAEMIPAADFASWAEGLEAGDDAARAGAAREREFARVYREHDRLLAEAGALDHGEVVLQAVRLLHEKPHVRGRLAEAVRHLLVDDLQEASFAESVLLGLAAAEHGSVTACADDDQALRRFRGAARKTLEDFRRDHPALTEVRLERSHRCRRRVLAAAGAAVATGVDRIPKRLTARAGGEVRCWRCRSERAQAQAVAAEAERLIALEDVPSREVAVLVRSLRDEGPTVAAALEEREIPFRLAGSAAYFQRAEVRDVLGWLRLLADPDDMRAGVRVLTRPPVELPSVDVARLTQLSRRRKLDIVATAQAALDGPQLSPEGRERVLGFLRLYRGAARAFEERRPDAFVHRLIERIGLRRRQVFAAQVETLERLANVAKLGELAAAYVRREPHASSRDFVRYLAAVAEAGLPEDEVVPPGARDAVQVMAMDAAAGLEWDHVFVVGLGAARFPGAVRRGAEGVPDALLKEELPPEGREVREAASRRLLHVAMSRARRGLVLAFAEGPEGTRPAPVYEEARAAGGAAEEVWEEELFGPAEGLHSTFRMMRDELLDTVARVGGRLSEMRLDTYLEVAQAQVRYLELVKLAALIERSKQGQHVAEALPEVNDLLLQSATPEQRQLFQQSALDDYLRDAERDERKRAEAMGGQVEPELDFFIPRRGRGLMLSASDIETYRLCPLKYKFARVFRIPEEPTINQRFGIVVHQVLERFHAQGGGSLDDLMELFEASWRRCGFGERSDDLQFREKAVAALRRYWELDREREGEPVWFERSFSFQLGDHLLRGRVDRVDRLPDGRYELLDYKTGKPKTTDELAHDVQLSLYQMGARESWELETAAQSYYYVLDNRKVPVRHSEEELDRVRATVGEIADGILAQDFEPRPSPELCAACDYRIICPAAEK